MTEQQAVAVLLHIKEWFTSPAVAVIPLKMLQSRCGGMRASGTVHLQLWPKNVRYSRYVTLFTR